VCQLSERPRRDLDIDGLGEWRSDDGVNRLVGQDKTKRVSISFQL
jgi:hypothetical protein